MDDDILIEDRPRRRFRWLPRFGAGAGTGSGWRRLRWVLGALVVLLLLYYPLGGLWVHEIDDDPNFAPAQVEPGASRTVAVAAALIDREVNQHSWPANHPWFFAGSVLDNMPNYQLGIIQALRRFALEMTDQIGRARGTSQADPDLERARSLLNYAADVWHWDFGVSIWPTATSVQQYRAAREALLSYNRRLAAGTAVFDHRADNLLATLDRIAKDLGSVSAALEQRVENHSGPLLDFEADDHFYRTKGELYAYALILRELGQDFAPIIAERGLQKVWDDMIENLFYAAGLQPWVVINGAPDSQAWPSHLAAQGFFLLRARSQMFEIADILLK
ncbi:MAG: DUF2333 family protein [Dongiaceae bacterium]